ncbi:hypothetical protein RB3362 [Rhodopirellula baltica SH 1]|uniref:Uncharacterized protein n=1 Tax=Rhodopirellula baltica (strain DSM 10527 / NCIMB 13988 / SH1) TaxID=243090 RepID=Q7UUD4_RHOBA|nr:hypothetical protein RB3362 [Rhodopirellula baltica SH 1]
MSSHQPKCSAKIIQARSLLRVPNFGLTTRILQSSSNPLNLFCTDVRRNKRICCLFQIRKNPPWLIEQPRFLCVRIASRTPINSMLPL